MSDNATILHLDEVVCRTNAVAISTEIRDRLIADLGPVADRLAGYASAAEGMQVRNQEEATEATTVLAAINADIAAVEKHETLRTITTGLHGLHKRWVEFRETFLRDLDGSKAKLRGKVVGWQRAEQARAAEQQRKLQAEADERARREREKLEAKAATYKTEEKREAALAAAQAVITPTVTVEAPKVLGTRKTWTAGVADETAFYAALTERPDLRGYATINITRLIRAKAANPTLTIAGIEFEQVEK